MITIALLESGADDKQISPIYMGKDVEGRFENEHAENVRKHLDRTLNGLEVKAYLLKKNTKGLEWCIKNADIVSMSALDFDYMLSDGKMMPKALAIEEELKHKCVYIVGAGNDGNKGESSASQRGAFSVGAVDNNLRPRNYSSWGLGEVDCVALDGVDGDFGTSFATPVVSGMCAIYMDRFEDAMGYKPSPKQVYKWIIKNCHDVWEEGFDMRTGNGLLKLPRRWVFKDVVYTENSEYKVERTWIDGTMSEERKLVYAPFYVPKGTKRSYVNPRGVTESLGGTIAVNKKFKGTVDDGSSERKAYFSIE